MFLDNIIYPLIFYILLIMVYLYSSGKFNINKQESYKEWVDTKGKKVSKAVLILGALYTVLLLLQSLF